MPRRACEHGEQSRNCRSQGVSPWFNSLIGRNIMKIKPLSVSMLFLGLQCIFIPASASSRHYSPAKLVGMGYHSARDIILGYGWIPVRSPCGQISSNTCLDFPEIGSCSGVDPGYCGMVFVKKSRCLYVVTVGGEPEVDKDGDTRIKKVTFRKGPCVKN